MSSSTSSSRRIFLRVFLVTLLGMGASMGIIRLITYANDVSGETILGRVIEAREALPRILAEEEDLMFFFGSSMVDAGFSPRRFDRRLAERGVEMKSFNFGFGGLNPLFQDFLARRIRDAFVAEDRRLELALLEFNPFQTTKARYNGAVPVIDSFVTMLASPQEMWEITLEDPARGIRMLNIHYLRDDISAEMITWQFGQGLREPRPRSSLPRDEEAGKRLGELNELLDERFDEDYPEHDGEDWWYPWQGAGTIPEERSESTREALAELYTILRGPRFMENDKLNRVHCCDIEELHFEEKLIEAYIRIVETFQEFSNHVEVVLLPKNSEWIHYSPEARQRLAVVLERIRRETGVTIKDLQDLEVITPDMYSDTTHLSRYAGDIAFTDFLVEEYGPLLGARPAPEAPMSPGGAAVETAAPTS